MQSVELTPQFSNLIPVQHPPLSPETALYTQKQCINCRKFYTEIENNYIIETKQQKPICIYHKSQRCCEGKLVKGVFSYGPRHSQGCIKAVKHQEDLGYSAIVAKFPVDKKTIEVIQQTHSYKAGAPSDGIAADGIQARNTDEFIMHRVAMTDTLMGVALYYQVKLEDIQRANNLDSHQIFHHKVLFIPRPDRSVVRPEMPPVQQTEDQIQARKAKQIKLFQQMSGIDDSEAKYYMELCDYHIDDAIAEWKTDTHWGLENKPMINKKPKSNNHLNTHKARACC